MGNLETPELVADIRSEGSPLENDALNVRLTRWSLVVKKLESGWEEQPTPKARGGDERNYPVSEVRGGWGELPHAPTPEARGCSQEEQPTPEARGGVERSYPEQWLHRRRRA